MSRVTVSTPSTLDRDRLSKGALTGGYHDMRRSRIEAIRNVAVWKDKFEAEDKRLKEVKSSILRVEQEVTQVTGKISVLVGQQKQVREAMEREGGNGSSRERRTQSKINILRQ
ncbi:hypothetical protein M378DRAFT_19146 [Amanita muscaria Koide BX008]|uniref:Uncharacterized protein n=1 Tax=Amanita muscaria (strain Koide BX008) TaxID=946122 RepID=A0A0C2RVB8_AMAMK|nr:hypothetical protein M378DRAFT_19146 [Amanita muscaria Koide BX008]